ncbi:phospholipid-binding protein MlaC [Collimonas sp. NPDC087041]|uniref:MlaC/ttg2D family ABC transporter substrate-binding protein n=1 Tax=Collimonas sp. NPDC087041 TaxID=3363960 RepID=UPI00380CAE06
MNILKKYLALSLTVGSLLFSATASAQEAPDALVKRISQDVLDTAKADKSVQGGNQQRILALVEEKIIPYVDFDRMTALAAGRYWRDATPDQQKQLIAQFRSLLIYTYSGALSQVRDQKIDFKPMRGDPSDTDVEVRSQVIQPGREPIQLNYRMEKIATGWKIYDVNVLGAWLVESYKGTFATEIGKSGIDGLIKVLSDKNKSRAAKNGK